MTKKLIFFDIDGTLVSHAGKSHIPEPTYQAVRELIQNGHVPAIATARNLALTRKTASLLGIDLVVCCNGAHAARISGGDIYSEWLGGGFAGMFSKSSSITEQSYALDPEHVYSDWEKDFFDIFIIEEAGSGCKKELASMKRAQLAYIFSARLPAWRECDDVEAIEYPECTEFRPPGVSKWSGIVRAAAAAGFSADDVITVGDAMNDVEMVKNAPIGIAVGGARESLKAVADLVTDDIDEGGILSAFRTLGMVN